MKKKQVILDPVGVYLGSVTVEQSSLANRQAKVIEHIIEEFGVA